MSDLIRMHSIYGRRHYHTMTDSGLVLLPSVTTVLRATMPTPQYLIDWYCDLGMDKAKAYTKLRAHYGTLLHILIASFLETKELDLSDVDSRCAAYIEANHVEGDTYTWCDDLKSDLLAFAEFCADRKVRPLHTELIMINKALGYAGTADIVCELEWRRRRVIAVVDIKSGRGKDSEEHGLQLSAYKELFNSYPNYSSHVTHCFKWSPKSWQSKPTYDLVNYSERRYWLWFELLLAIYNAQQDAKAKQPTMRTYAGAIELGKPVMEQYRNVEVTQFLEDKFYREVGAL